MKRETTRETGIALLLTLLLMFVFTIMTLGFYYMTTGEQKIAVSDRDNTVAFYGAEAGLEKMSADLASWFAFNPSPTPAQIDALTTAANRPSVPGVNYPTSPNGYVIQYQTNADGTLKSTTDLIGGTGPLAGLTGIITPLTLTVTADGPNATEVKFTRTVQEVAVPVFQFGIFSDNDLSFFAGPDFNFGGRVHTNGCLFVTEGNGKTLTLADKSTAYQQVVRAQLSNGWLTSSNYNGTVDVVTTPGTYRNLAQTEGSVTDSCTSSANPTWPAISLATYNGNIRTKLTGARKLSLAVALGGGSPIDLIRRPPVGESPTSTVGIERFYNKASLRILISDGPATNITNLPGIDNSKPPYPLDENLIDRSTPGLNNYLPTVSACQPPMAESLGYPTDHDYMTQATKTLLSGAATSYIKIEIQLASSPGTWKDVTQEVLSLGILLDPTGANCPVASNKSIIHLERLRPGAAGPTTTATNFVPINLYDPREGELRDVSQTGLALGGTMNIVEVDVHNLQLWFANTLDPVNAPSGALALANDGYILYTSDRRGNTNSSGNETGDYGWDDIVNPNDPTGAPNGVLDPAEDVHQAPYPPYNPATFNVYGATAHPLALDNSGTTHWPLPSSTTYLQDFTGASPLWRITGTQAEKNAIIFFRRALRLVNGKVGNMPPLAHANCSNLTAGGFTVASEDPIYVQGEYNADAANGFNDTATNCHVPAAVIGDAVTLLSDVYKDSNAFTIGDSLSCSSSPNRCATTTWYRAAIVSGKNYSFARPTWAGAGQDFGTDGGAHNFLRYIENWGGQTLNYRGSIVSFYVSRQATGIYKCCTVVYSPPTRGYNFDTDFTNIGLLPPGTPRFSDVNALSFTQAVLPNQ